MAEVIAERSLVLGGDDPRTVNVRVYKPERSDIGWVCFVEIAGLPERFSREIAGSDGLSALRGAIDAVAAEIEHHEWQVQPPRSTDATLRWIAAPQAGDSLVVWSASAARMTLYKPVKREEQWECQYLLEDFERGSMVSYGLVGSDSMQALIAAVRTVEPVVAGYSPP